jgi:hypothetical protein
LGRKECLRVSGTEDGDTWSRKNEKLRCSLEPKRRDMEKLLKLVIYRVSFFRWEGYRSFLCPSLRRNLIGSSLLPKTGRANLRAVSLSDRTSSKLSEACKGAMHRARSLMQLISMPLGRLLTFFSQLSALAVAAIDRLSAARVSGSS